MKSKGLGDSIEKVTKATGVKWVVEKFTELTGVDCGCENRKERLNKLFPYNAPEMQDDVINDAWHFVNSLGSRISQEDRLKLLELHKTYINPLSKDTTCVSCLNRWILNLKIFFNKD